MGITELIAAKATALIGSAGYPGITFLMTLESMVFPVPSEAVMPFAGFLIADGRLTWLGVGFAASLGSIIGSLISYAIGRFGGQPFIDRFGKYLLIDNEELAWTQKFFAKRGGLTIFISRFIPVVRHLISVPAGMGRMALLPFIILTLLGASCWNLFLAYVGFRVKEHWGVVMKYSHHIDILVVAGLAGLVVLYVYRHLNKSRK